MKIVVVGAGAMGSLFGGMLTESGEDVTIFCKSKDQAQDLNRDGLIITAGERRRLVKVKSDFEACNIEPMDLVLFLVKSYDTRRSVKDALPFISDDAFVLTLQNGLGNIEELSDVFGRKNIIAGTTSQGATLIRPGEILHAGKGPTSIGELDGDITDRLLRINSVFNKAGLETKIVTNILEKMWVKVVVNAAINPITALVRIKNGDIIKDPNLKGLCKKVMLEALQVAVKLGINIDHQVVLDTFYSIMESTTSNNSSMLQDVLNDKQTEIESLNGKIISLGKEIGVSTTVNEVLTGLIRGLE